MDTVQVIAEPRRRQILSLIWEDELAAGEIASRFDVTFGAVSQHLGVLRDAGLVTVRKAGNRRMYRARQEVLAPFEPLIRAMWEQSLGELARAAEAEERH